MWHSSFGTFHPTAAAVRRVATTALSLGVLTGLLGSGLITPQAFAESELDSFKDPLIVQLDTELTAGNAVEGQPFEASLTETYVHNDLTLPAGTKFSGVVADSKYSRRFLRPGYVSFDVKTATLPNGDEFDFTTDKYTTREKKVHHPESPTVKKFAIGASPLTATGAAVSIPLNLATGLGRLVIIPIALGARTVTGSIIAYREQPEDQRTVKSVLLGGLDRSTAFKGTRTMVTVPNNPTFRPGDNVKLHFDPDGLETLFQEATAQQKAVSSLH